MVPNLVSFEHGFVNTRDFSIHVSHWSGPVLTEPRKSIVLVPPFWEEMHVSRRFMACLARNIAPLGYHVFLYDPPGMGETLPSRPTTFRDHVAVLNLVLDFLEDKPKLLLSFRGGFLTVDRMLLETPERASIHCTSGPIVEGEKLLHELLRQKSIASRLSGIDPITTDELKAQLASGKDIRIAGSPVTAAFAQQISAHSAPASGGAVAQIQIGLASERDRPAVPGFKFIETSAPDFWRDGTGDEIVFDALSKIV